MTSAAGHYQTSRRLRDRPLHIDSEHFCPKELRGIVRQAEMVE
jgi:hypothetical protein